MAVQFFTLSVILTSREITLRKDIFQKKCYKHSKMKLIFRVNNLKKKTNENMVY